MTQRHLRPFSRILLLMLSLSIVVPSSYGQMGGYRSSGNGDANSGDYGASSTGMGMGLTPSGQGNSSFDAGRSATPSIRQFDQSDDARKGGAWPYGGQSQADNNGQALRPLPPNEFQRFVLETSGQALPLFGTSFFNQARSAYAPQGNTPVSPDYRIGPGDELQIRGWGSVDIDVRAVVDRNGQIHIPRVGSVNLSGIRSSQAEDVIRSAVGKYYRDFQLSVTLGQLRGITVYVVGQARKPGAYQLTSASTLVSALFASGGPSQTGSMRSVQVKRGDKLVTELDLYAFLSKGDKSADVKLQDGDTIVIPPAKGYVALSGKVGTPAVYELANDNETIGSLLSLAGGLPVVADPKRAQLERVDPLHKPARTVEAFALDAPGLSKRLKSGDMLVVSPLVPEFENTVTLRGNVTQPLRSPWRPGMKVRDLIPNKGFLMSRESVKRQNDVLLTDQDKRRARSKSAFAELEDDANGVMRRRALPNGGDASARGQNKAIAGANGFDDDDAVANNSADASDTEVAVRSRRAGDTVDTLAQRVGNLVDEVNMDYAVVERVDTANVTVKLLPFNLGNALADANSPDNLALQPGDIVTVFSVNDVRVPQAKRQVFVRVEGEVQRPGIYQMTPGDSLPQLIDKAGGLTPDAYLYGAAFYREEVRQAQKQNLDQLVRRLGAQIDSKLSSAAASVSSTDAPAAQLRIEAEAQAQRQALERLKNLQPTGRIMLGLDNESRPTPSQLPKLRLENQDRLVVPPRPDFVYVLGSVNSEASHIWREGESVSYYLSQSGLTSGADVDELFVLRADGSVLSNSGRWFSSVTGAKVLPGDVIVLPEKTDHESAWSVFTRNAKDITQIIYQFSLGAAAIKTLRE